MHDQDPLVIANQQDLDHNQVVLVIYHDDQQLLRDELMRAGEDFENGGEFHLGSSPIPWQDMTNQ